jgi:hypothetical protein
MPSISYEFVASGHDAVRRAYLSIAEAEEKAAAASARASARVSDALKGLAKTKLPSSPVARTEAAGVAAARDRIAQESRDRLRSIREEERARVQSARRIAQEEARHKRDMERIDRESDRRFEKAQAAREKAAAREAESKQASYLASKREKSSTSSGAMKEFFGSMLAMRAYDKLMGTVESAARESIALQESTNRLSISARGGLRRNDRRSKRVGIHGGVPFVVDRRGRKSGFGCLGSGERVARSRWSGRRTICFCPAPRGGGRRVAGAGGRGLGR